ncbi:MAG TPA: hypothetical protein VH475_10255 [Tepidisphaeraceae bacterium]|jgi:hypothetical protein
MTGGVGVESHIELLVAALDLKMVQLVRDAMRTADRATAKELGVLEPAARFEPRVVYHPTPRFEPRPVYHPTPRFEPRPIVHPTPRVVDPPPAVCPPREPECPRISKPVFVPPWKVMPWENPPQPALKVKVIKLQPDRVRKGSLIDCFI